jgi:hypothetical protein
MKPDKQVKYHDANGQLTKAGVRLYKKARNVLKPLIQPAKNGWEAKEREMIIASALSGVRVLKAMKMLSPLRKRRR